MGTKKYPRSECNSHHFFQCVLDQTIYPMMIFDNETVHGCNAQFEVVTGFSAREIKNKEGLTEVFESADTTLCQTDPYPPNKVRFIKDKYKRSKPLKVRVQPLFEAGTFMATIHETEDHYDLDNLPLALIKIGLDRQITYINPAFTLLSGYDINDSIGMNITYFIDESSVDVDGLMLQGNLQTGRLNKIEVKLKTKSGVIKVVEMVFQHLFKGEKLAECIIVVTDITEQKLAEKELSRKAFYDSLTDLPNRCFFMECLENAIAKSKRGSKSKFSLMLLDLDNFKYINDNYGHIIGDKLLQSVSLRFIKLLRDIDVVSRFGGDEFAILLDDTDQHQAWDAAKRVLDSFDEPFEIDGNIIHTTASIGLIPNPKEEDAENLYRNADIAMYNAKRNGKKSISHFYPKVKEIFETTSYELVEEIREGLRKDQFQNYYQLVTNMGDLKLVGMEALVRWFHPKRDVVTPSYFIELAEESGLIIDIGYQVIRNACKDFMKMKEVLSLSSDVYLSINVSIKQLQSDQFTLQLNKILKELKFDPKNLKLEISENILSMKSEYLTNIFKELYELGCRISIDDFGSGMTSLLTIHRYDVDCIKVDGGLIQELIKNKDTGMLKSIVKLGQSLSIDVIVKGIENTNDAKLMQQIGCVYGQGYLYSKPMGINELITENQFSQNHKVNI